MRNILNGSVDELEVLKKKKIAALEAAKVKKAEL
jgi:hypothetical protein